MREATNSRPHLSSVMSSARTWSKYAWRDYTVDGNNVTVIEYMKIDPAL